MAALVLVAGLAQTAVNNSRDRTPALVPPPGFSIGPGPPPVTGIWQAAGLTTSSIGYSNSPAGSTTLTSWRVTRTCTPDCAYTLILPLPTYTDHRREIRASLVKQADGWHVVWPVQQLPCGGTASHPLYWGQQTEWIINFTGGGREATAHESIFSYASGCGYGRASRIWHGTVNRPPPLTSQFPAPGPAT